jgi:hypothetical protein
MKLFSRSSSSDTPGQVTRVIGQPTAAPGAVPGGAGSPGAPHAEMAAPAGGVTPVPSRLARLAAVVDKARPGRAGRNVRKILQTLGMAAIVLGFVAILLGWYGASHSAYQYQEIPYLISGGLLGVALVIAGGVLVHSAWTLRTVEEDRRNALAIVRSVDRLERILRSLDETRRADADEHAR